MHIHIYMQVVLDLNQRQLYHQRTEDNDQEEGVLEHALEHVELIVDLCVCACACG